jgi:hypothetical protein
VMFPMTDKEMIAWATVYFVVTVLAILAVLYFVSWVTRQNNVNKDLASATYTIIVTIIITLFRYLLFPH